METPGLRVGTKIGKWCVESQIGSGATGSVYAVVHELIGKRAAVKVLDPGVVSPIMIERSRLEAQIVNQVPHRNIVDIFQAGMFEGRPYLVMEHLDGKSLADHAAEEKLPADRVIAILLEMCAALAAAHAAGVVHRDLKPENVFVLVDPANHADVHVKVLDWGLAKLLDDRSHRTAEGQILGTPYYLSPEQACGRPVSPKSDVYSLGIVAYELFLEQRPFDHATTVEVLHMQLHQSPPLPRDVWPAIPDVLEDLILAMLAKDPAKRPTIAAVAAGLAAARGDLEHRREAIRRRSAQLSRPPRGAAARAPVGRRAAAVLGGVLACATVSLGLFGGDDDPGAQRTLAVTELAAAAPSSPPREVEVPALAPPPAGTTTQGLRLPVAPSAPIVRRPPVTRVAAVAPQPPPPVAADPGNSEVAARYVAVGRSLKAHGELGDIDVADLWSRYRLLRIADAFTSSESRVRAAATLVELEHAILARSSARARR